MDPFTAIAIGSAAASIGGGILGGSAASAEADKADALIRSAIARIEALPIPEEIKNEIKYQQFQVVGDFTPQSVEKTIAEYAPLALEIEDPRNKARQESVYAQIQQASLTGLSPQDKLAMQMASRKTTQDVLSKIMTAESQAKQRGQFGAGQQFASQLQAAQSGADRQSMENLQAAANASTNRLAQQQNLYNMATGMRASTEDLGRRNTEAMRKRDEQMMDYARSDRNLNLSQRVAMQNALNQATQQASRENVLTSQREAYRLGHEVPISLYNARLGKESAIANLMGKQADVHMGRGAAKAQMYSQIGSGVGEGLMGYGGFMQGQDKISAIKDNTKALRGASGMSSGARNSASFFGLDEDLLG